MFESRTTSPYRSAVTVASASAVSPLSSNSTSRHRRRWNTHNRNRDRNRSRDLSEHSISVDSNRVSVSAPSLMGEQQDQDHKVRSPMMKLLHKLVFRCWKVLRRKRRKKRQRFNGQPTKKMKNRCTEYTMNKNKNENGSHDNNHPVGAASARSSPSVLIVPSASSYSPALTTQTGITVPCDEHEMYFMLRSKSSSTPQYVPKLKYINCYYFILATVTKIEVVLRVKKKKRKLKLNILYWVRHLRD
mmetsp:Transcript_11108/g.12824  ORF Transcript_11108/g.12824 Transcript_11108/m.12824 type:complete len:245 (+) Transcript_11108:205-939(+)